MARRHGCRATVGRLGWIAARGRHARRARWRLNEQQRICWARERTNLGPGRLAGLLGRSRSTIHKVLTRHGLSRRRRAPRRTFRRDQWSEPGALLHMDVKRLAASSGPGTGRWVAPSSTRRAVPAGSTARRHRRPQPLLYVEQHPREDAETNARTLERALAHFADLGLRAPQAVMTDNAKVYSSHRFKDVLLATAGACHITPPPYTPRWNGKACVLASGCRPSGRRGSPRPVV